MILVPHDPGWAAEFEALRRVYLDALGELVVAIEHVGSTSVPGLVAKPVLDIDLVMPDYASFATIVARLGELGYTHQGDLGLAEREAFRRADGQVPRTAVSRAHRTWLDHNLYVCPAAGVELGRHVRFRDALKQHAELRAEYAAIKRDIESRSGGQRATYVEIKQRECTDFIERVLAMR